MPNASQRGFARSIQSRQRLTHMIASRVDGTGTAALLSGSNELTLTDNGTGDYTLTYAVPFKQVPVVVALSKTADSILILAASAVGSCQITAFDATDGTTAKDVDFDILILGSDAADAV